MQTQQPIEAFPFSWPVSWARTSRPKSSRFKTTFKTARDGVLREVRLMGGKGVIISSNIPLKRDGLPYASFPKLSDTGIAVYFTYNNEQVVFACDYWDRCEDNMQAIHKTINAFRMMPEWGVSEMLKHSFAGLKALPEKTESQSDIWYSVLGVSEYAPEAEVKEKYRSLLMKHHPDKGGDVVIFHKIQAAYDFYRTNILKTV